MSGGIDDGYSDGVTNNEIYCVRRCCHCDKATPQTWIDFIMETPCCYDCKKEIMETPGPLYCQWSPVISELVRNSEPTPPEFSKTIDEHFWGLSDG